MSWLNHLAPPVLTDDTRSRIMASSAGDEIVQAVRLIREAEAHVARKLAARQEWKEAA